MEIILRLYLLPFNPARPVICFDERPCFLLGDIVQGLAMKEGSPKKENYAYSKHGSCCVLAAIEPKTGKRLAHVKRHRGCREFAIFMRNLARLYPDAVKICVVLDNLNTHTIAAFYHTFPAAEAAELADRFEFYYTPKSASWLNMIEIEFSALSKQCLDRRISSINVLTSEVMTYFKERDRLAIKINWQFSCESARQKLNRHYCKVNSENSKYKII
jgi:DDE superfamily endonuclease